MSLRELGSKDVEAIVFWDTWLVPFVMPVVLLVTQTNRETIGVGSIQRQEYVDLIEVNLEASSHTREAEGSCYR